MHTPKEDNERFQSDHYTDETNRGNGPVHHSVEDGALVQALSKGAHQAYDKLFIKYYDRTLNFVRSLIKNQAEAEDIVEDVFVKIWTGRDQLDPAKNFNAYLYRITRNAVFNHFRSQKVHSQYVGNQLGTADRMTEGTDEEFIAKETELLIALAVSQMPQQRRRIFEMRQREGLTNAEIAAQLGITVKAVEKSMRQALSDIRKVITAFLAFIYFS